MPVAVQCVCGVQLKANDELQGKSAKCPKCGNSIAVPHHAANRGAAANNVAAPAITVQCACGRTIRANSQLAGKQVNCPACQLPLQIPGGVADASGLTLLEPSDDAADPFGLNTMPSATAGMVPPPAGNSLGAPQQMPAGFTFAPVAGTQTPQANNYTQPRRRTKRTTTLEIESDIFTIIVAVFCILHGLGRISVFGIAFLFTSGGIFSLVGIVSLLTVAASIGIGVAGVGLLTNQYWAKQVGGISAVVYLVLMVTSLVVAMIASSSETTGLAMRFSYLWVPRLLAEAVTPAMLLYKLSRDD